MRQAVIRKVRRIVVASRLKPAGIELACSDDTILFLNKIDDIYFDRISGKLRYRYSDDRFSLSFASIKYNANRILQIRDGQIDSTDKKLISS